jgi:hypothetical protein
MTFFRKVALLMTLLLSPFTSPHRMVFEEIGEMAGALLYIHAIVPVKHFQPSSHHQEFPA